MVNSEQVKEEILALGLQPGAQIIPNPIPVVETNPKLLRRCDVVRSNTATNSTSVTLYTTPTDKDFFLVGCGVSVIKDVTSTSLYTRMQITPAGDAARQILNLPGLSLTVQTLATSLSLPDPIKLERNTTITIQNSTNVANITASGYIIGYLVEPNQ